MLALCCRDSVSPSPLSKGFRNTPRKLAIPPRILTSFTRGSVFNNASQRESWTSNQPDLNKEDINEGLLPSLIWMTCFSSFVLHLVHLYLVLYMSGGTMCFIFKAKYFSEMKGVEKFPVHVIDIIT